MALAACCAGTSSAPRHFSPPPPLLLVCNLQAVGGSMAASAILYTAIGVGGFLLWGQAVQGDVLSNLGIDAVAEMLGGNMRLAEGFVATVKVRMVQ